MCDRLQLLRSRAQVSTPISAPPPQSDPFQSFWNTFTTLQGKIYQIDEKVRDITQLDEEIAGCFDQHEAESKRTILNKTMKSIPVDANNVRTELEELKAQVDQLDKDRPGSAEARLQKNHLHLLNNEFSDIVTKFTKVQDEIKSKFRDQIIRQSRIAGQNLDPNKVDDILQNNPGSIQQNMFQIQGGAATAQAAAMYEEIYNRHQDILEIDRMLNELLEMFVQFAVIVKDQGRIIDNIESNISAAREYVAQGVEELETAREYQKKSRKCLWWIVGVVVVILIVVVVIIVFVT